MINIISFSGGIGSAITAELVAKKYGTENTFLLFADTKTEDEDLYRFNLEVASKLNLELITIQDGRDVWDVFESERYIGNSRVDPCSRVLKRNLIKNWINKNFNADEVEIFVGIDCTEEHRLNRIVKNNLPLIYRSILVENEIFLYSFTRQQWCDSLGIKIPRLYSMGFAHNNCGGFCVKSGLKQFKLLHDNFPERYLYHENRERQAINTNPKLRPFLRKQINGNMHYLTLEEYRLKYLNSNEKLNNDEELEYAGCGCALE